MTTSDARVLAKRSRTAGARTASLLSLALLGAGAASADEAVLIGGGYTLQGSQGQIELNVRWVGNILAERGLPTTTFFTDGDAPGPDVHFAQPADAPGGPLEPLARVFGDLALERRRYREHAVPDVAGTTRRDALEPALGTLFERTSDEPLLLVYNGHGRQSPAAPAGVTLHLWDDTEMTARELHALLGRHRGDAPDPFRFVFTQCYSGGFHRLAYADADDGLALADTPRCGFTAESAYRLAEGCSAGVDIGDYRDYTTFFFAALADRERDGTVLDRDPDTDADGTVTLREAHLHALEKAWSTDLSRSTSEDWLEAWQPWQLRWLPQPPSPPDNEYAELFRRLAVDAGIPLDGRVGRTLRERLADDEDRLAALSSERATLREDIDVARDALRRHATEAPPRARRPLHGRLRRARGERRARARRRGARRDARLPRAPRAADARRRTRERDPRRRARRDAQPEAPSPAPPGDAEGPARDPRQRRRTGELRLAPRLRGAAARHRPADRHGHARRLTRKRLSLPNVRCAKPFRRTATPIRALPLCAASTSPRSPSADGTEEQHDADDRERRRCVRQHHARAAHRPGRRRHGVGRTAPIAPSVQLGVEIHQRARAFGRRQERGRHRVPLRCRGWAPVGRTAPAGCHYTVDA